MAEVDPNLLKDLEARGLVAQMTGDGELERFLAEQSRTLYCGFDPTADSLHIGSLVPLLALKRFQQAGHKPIVLVGGATGLIGDPSFKSQERRLNTAEVVAEWVEKIKTQVSSFVDFGNSDHFAGSGGGTSGNAAEIVNNLDWVSEVNVLDFLRDVGKHFSVSNMINKESVKQRIDREGEGISFTEFSYMLLQSYDFAELYQRYNCTLQIGGSDQWGNIVGGVDLTKRLYGVQVYGLTLPLVTKADGTKFGKTETGTIWLDPTKTSPYAFYQFWLNTADADVYKFLRYFTFLSIEKIVAIEGEDRESEGRPQAQSVLAREVTKLVHGEHGLAAAQRITDALFNGTLSQLGEGDLEQLKLDGLPSTTLDRASLPDLPMTQLFTDCGLAVSGKQVKDALGRNAVLINGEAKSMADNLRLPECFAENAALYGRYFVVRLGKKKYHLFDLG